ncbi:MAG: hypothetical protein JW737_00325 [Acidobacteria bacterium]|nr:hypothetical protein [Acidobacteriota bacterium]
MSKSFIKTILIVILIGHGIGHAMCFFPLFGFNLSKTHSSDSWLLTSLLGETVSKIAYVLIWATALILFVLAGSSLAGWVMSATVWKGLAIAASAVSLGGLILFWNSFPFLSPNKIGVIAVDLFFLVSLLFTDKLSDL